MIPAELSSVVEAAVRDAVATGDLTLTGTISARRAIVSPGPCGGRYPDFACTMPFRLSGPAHAEPRAVAAVLAARLRSVSWLSEVDVAGPGYLNVTVTPDALGGLARRIVNAGDGYGRSDACQAQRTTAAVAPSLATIPSWAEARNYVVTEVTGRLREAAGASVTWNVSAERLAKPTRPTIGGPTTSPDSTRLRPNPSAEQTDPAAVVALAGEDSVRFALCRIPPHAPVVVDAINVAVHHPDNPAYAVRYAHAHGAATLRQAADLGIDPDDADRFQPRLLDHPREQALLAALSWLPDRVADAARRGQPFVLTRYLECLTGTYHDFHEACRVLRHDDAETDTVIARLWLTAATVTTLAAGLALLGVHAPHRI